MPGENREVFPACAPCRRREKRVLAPLPKFPTIAPPTRAEGDGGMEATSAEEDPGDGATPDHARPSLLARALVGWTRLCIAHSVTILVLAIASAVAAGWWTSQKLG